MVFQAFLIPLPCLRRGCLHGLVWGKLTCHTGVGRTWLRSQTAVCDGCLVSPVTLVSAPTWRSLRCQDLKPIHARPLPMASFVKKLLVRGSHMLPANNVTQQLWSELKEEKKKTHSFPSSPGNPSQSSRPSCKKPCSLHTNCGNCTSQAMECMWCGSVQRCVDSTAYVISFPYGQCLEWQTGDCVGKCKL